MKMIFDGQESVLLWACNSIGSFVMYRIFLSFGDIFLVAHIFWQ